MKNIILCLFLLFPYQILCNQNAQHFETNDVNILKIAEKTRKEVYKKWFELDEVDWESKCDIQIDDKIEQRAYTRCVIKSGKVASRLIVIKEYNEDVIRHEVAHACLAGMFNNSFPPRWADEGIAVLTESKHSFRYRQEYSIKELMFMEEYPLKINAFYSQSVGLVEYLRSVQKPIVLVSFIRDGMTEESLEKHYKLTFSQLEKKLNEK